MLVGTFACTLSVAAAAAAGPLWPEMRHDLRNTGSSTIVAGYHGDRPWTYFTARGIFSTPIIGGGGTVYVGSADGSFYALTPAGRLRFRIRTGGIIDAAGAVTAGAHGGDVVTFGSGNALLYHMAVGRTGGPRLLWRFRATKPPVPGQEVDWWEGDVVAGPGGNLFAGNTGGTAYSLTPTGHLRWTYTGGNSIWTAPAFAADGSSFWGSLDLHAFKLDASGHSVWQTFTPGYVVSSPALGSDGTVYVGVLRLQAVRA